MCLKFDMIVVKKYLTFVFTFNVLFAAHNWYISCLVSLFLCLFRVLSGKLLFTEVLNMEALHPIVLGDAFEHLYRLILSTLGDKPAW